MLSTVRIAVLSLLLLTILTGILYPLAVTGIVQMLFPHQANGSIILRNGQPVGSELVGQQFEDRKYFWGRLSATGPYPYNSASSAGSNLGPNNPDLTAAAASRIKALRNADPGNAAMIPVDLVTASGSGLDPHISPAAAEYQVRRVARARGLKETTVRTLVDRHTKGRVFGILGEPVVAVLELNLALDEER
jgi:K+-transporting ATPase ATPase C chain